MTRVLTLSFLVAFLSACSTTVKRLELTAVDLGNGEYATYYELTDELVAKDDGRNDSAQFLTSAMVYGEDFQLFPSMCIKQEIMPKAMFPVVRRDRLKTCGQTVGLGDAVPILSTPVFRISTANLSPDGKTLAISCQEAPDSEWSIWLVDDDGRNPRMLTRGRDADWLNEDTLVYVTKDANSHFITRCDVKGGNKSIVLQVIASISHLAVDPTGTRIAHVVSHSEDGSDSLVRVYDLAKKETDRVTMHPARDDAPVWSEDGKELFFRSTRGGQWGIWSKTL